LVLNTKSPRQPRRLSSLLTKQIRVLIMLLILVFF